MVIGIGVGIGKAVCGWEGVRQRRRLCHMPKRAAPVTLGVETIVHYYCTNNADCVTMSHSYSSVM